MDNAKNIVILTATITPPAGAIKMTRMDPQLRYSDYKKAFEFYLRELGNGVFDGLVFADNSNSDVAELSKMAEEKGLSSQVEIIAFEGLDYPPTYGRGYGEFKLLDYVMSNSSLIKSAPEDSNFWKITGRYILENIDAIIKSKPVNIDLYCHCRNIPMRWMDLYVMCWNWKAYTQCIENICGKIREDVISASSETEFRDIVESHKSAISIKQRFKYAPRLEGVRGYDNQAYQDMGLKQKVRELANVIFPWIWI